MAGSLRLLPAAALLSAGVTVAFRASAQGGGTPAPLACPSAGEIAWNEANRRGEPGRRDALKAVLAASAAGDANAVPCLIRKVRKDLAIAASESSALEGWAKVIKVTRYNANAARAQPAKDQCAAITLFATAWEQFHTNNRTDLPALIGQSVLNDKAMLCGA